MKTSPAIPVLAAAGAFCVLVIIVGCQIVTRRGATSMYRESQHSLKAHGGTANVNDAAFDAMFFKNYGVNPFVDTDDDHLSTFAVDVDTGSYTVCRSYLNGGNLPPDEGVRVEEFTNYFDYGYAPPAKDAGAFAIHLEAARSKFGRERAMLRIGIKAREIDVADRADAVLTFVIDTSGSMVREDRLELVKKSLRLLLNQMREGDRVGIAVYGSRGRMLMSHRGADDREEILGCIARLQPDGSTNAAEGLTIGYEMATKAFKKGAVNHVILCSDGVANVGPTGPDSILREIRKNAAGRITLSTVGFGMGNYNDVLMEQLADKGDGNYAYVDTLAAARRIFVENLTGTLQLVARDVKVQVDFNPAVVRSYRLLGYENRDVADEDFRNDKADGGEIGAGHSVTALYELKLWEKTGGRLATVRVRHKDAEGAETHEVKREIAASEATGAFQAASSSFRLAACVAEFAEILRNSYWARGSKADDVLAPARRCASDYDGRQDIEEFVSLVETAKRLKAD